MQVSENSCGTTADALNTACFCITLDPRALGNAVESVAQGSELTSLLQSRCPYIFAGQPVFIAPTWLHRMQEVVATIERLVRSERWQQTVLASAPPIVRHEPMGAQGVFFGYDFHLEGDQLGLVEINTNAGGALLNTLLARAQRQCCSGVQPLSPDDRGADGFEAAIVRMFQQEWAAGGSTRTLRTIALVDHKPAEQYLYPEFLLFQRLFQAAGLDCVIADPSELHFDGQVLSAHGTPIDLVYNRLTDFYLEAPTSATLREAYLADAITLTPNPRAYALQADKRRLIQLTDRALLDALGVDAATRELIAAHVPQTVWVTPADAEALWAKRRQLFFKPVSGYGSRGAYRGDKLTRRVWEDILHGDYVAQTLIAPGSRQVGPAAAARTMKFDLRAYVYTGAVQWIAARVYQGQTTNFRSEGGGFAPVYSLTGASQPGASARHASYTFLLGDDGDVQALPHALYQALIHAEPAPPALWGMRYRLADWYVALADERPARVVREWYGWVRIDEQGHFHPEDAGPGAQARGPDNIDPTALPTATERQRLQDTLFAGA